MADSIGSPDDNPGPIDPAGAPSATSIDAPIPPSIASPDRDAEPITVPDPPRDRLAWGFPIGCAVVAALAFGVTRYVASPIVPPEATFFAAAPRFPTPDEPMGEASVLPMPFITRPIVTKDFFAPGPPRGRISTGAISIRGRALPDVVKRILRRNHGRTRACYEEGLRANPNLMGRVNVRFVIGRDGAISNVESGGSDLPDGGVIACILRGFHGLSFPAPAAGIATVVYPISLSPR